MGFKEAWGFDPEEVFTARKSTDRELRQEGVSHNIGEDDAMLLPADASAQVTELRRIFALEEV